MESTPQPVLESPEKETPPHRRRRSGQVHIAFLPLIFLLGLGVGYLAWNRPQPPTAPQATAEPTSPPEAIKRYDVPVDDDPTLGPANAPITFIMYSDYECPFCKKWYDEVFKPLSVDYATQVRFVYKDFPLYGLHDSAAPAAEAANCAGEQGKYWEYQDKLFSMEMKLETGSYKKYAQDLSLDSAKFEECLSSRRYEAEVKADYDFAARMGIQSTPTFFINGLALVGAQPLEVFRDLLDQELAGKIP